MPSELDLAWAAGFIDGEGSIHIRIDKTGRTSPRYTLILTATNTNKESIDKLKNILYGTTPSIKMRKGNTKPIYRFTSSANKALENLKLIQKYSIVKREQIKLGIEFQSQPSINPCGKKLSDEYHNLQKQYYDKMHLLNKMSGDLK